MSASIINKTLLICPAVGIWQKNGEFYFDKKFYEGMKMYKNFWLGKIKLLISIETNKAPDFGLVKYSDNSKDLFETLIINQNDAIMLAHLQNVDVVLASADDFRQVNLAKLSKIAKVKCIYV